MAMLADAVHDAHLINSRLGGGKRTQDNRIHIVTPFLRICRQIGELRPFIGEISESAIHFYAAYCMAQAKKPGDLQNIFSTLRVVFKEAGHDIDNTCSNRLLGVPRKARKGARRAHTVEEFEALVKRAKPIDEGLALMIRLARYLGLRRKEAVASARDFRMWRDAIIRGDTTLDVLRGTKNGRPRTVRIIPDKRLETLAAIEAALEYVQDRNFQLITGRGNTLESAINRVAKLLRRAGMVGELSFHSLRYNYAQESAIQMLDAGVPPYETLVILSESLGHGPTRVKMILSYYCQPIMHRFKGQLSLSKNEAHRRKPAKPLPRATARQQAKIRHGELSGFPVGRTDRNEGRGGSKSKRAIRGSQDSGDSGARGTRQSLTGKVRGSK